MARCLRVRHVCRLRLLSERRRAPSGPQCLYALDVCSRWRPCSSFCRDAARSRRNGSIGFSMSNAATSIRRHAVPDWGPSRARRRAGGSSAARPPRRAAWRCARQAASVAGFQMNRLAGTLAQVSGDLDQLAVSWAVVGGLAVSVRGEPRLTRDIDVAVSVESDRDSERIFPSLRVPVARRPHLIAMKLLARDDRVRPQDFDDLRSLLLQATEEEISDARRLLALITQRGFARRRDLGVALDDVVRELRR